VAAVLHELHARAAQREQDPFDDPARVHGAA
jgi:hypothetical protein